MMTNLNEGDSHEKNDENNHVVMIEDEKKK